MLVLAANRMKSNLLIRQLHSVFRNFQQGKLITIDFAPNHVDLVFSQMSGDSIGDLGDGQRQQTAFGFFDTNREFTPRLGNKDIARDVDNRGNPT